MTSKHILILVLLLGSLVSTSVKKIEECLAPDNIVEYHAFCVDGVAEIKCELKNKELINNPRYMSPLYGELMTYCMSRSNIQGDDITDYINNLKITPYSMKEELVLIKTSVIMHPKKRFK